MKNILGYFRLINANLLRGLKDKELKSKENKKRMEEIEKSHLDLSIKCEIEKREKTYVEKRISELTDSNKRLSLQNVNLEVKARSAEKFSNRLKSTNKGLERVLQIKKEEAEKCQLYLDSLKDKIVRIEKEIDETKKKTNEIRCAKLASILQSDEFQSMVTEIDELWNIHDVHRTIRGRLYSTEAQRIQERVDYAIEVTQDVILRNNQAEKKIKEYSEILEDHRNGVAAEEKRLTIVQEESYLLQELLDSTKLFDEFYKFKKAVLDKKMEDAMMATEHNANRETESTESSTDSEDIAMEKRLNEIESKIKQKSLQIAFLRSWIEDRRVNYGDDVRHEAVQCEISNEWLPPRFKQNGDYYLKRNGIGKQSLTNGHRRSCFEPIQCVSNGVN